MSCWVPLHLYSQYSILDGTASVEEIVARAAEYQMSSVALTDQGNLYGTVDFFKACHQTGVKPILGCTLMMAPDSRHNKKRIPGSPAGFPIVLLVKNLAGYHNLCELVSLASIEGFYYTPRIDHELLSKHAQGLICLSGPIESKIASLILRGEEEALHQQVAFFRDLFRDDFYFEIQRHQMKPEDIVSDGLDKEDWAYQSYLSHVVNQEKVIQKLKELSVETGIPCVVTHESHYLAREDWRAHEILMNVQSGEPCEIWERDSQGNPKTRVLNPKRKIASSHALQFKSQHEIEELFPDDKEAIACSLAIADKCQFILDMKTKHYPVYIPPGLEGQKLSKDERIKGIEEFLRQLCEEGLQKLYTPDKLAKVAEKYPGKDPLVVVRERLEYELGVIIPKGMADYLLIVYDFINWAKMQGIPMGPGRGSGAGSIILYLIGITDIEPLRFNLFFERFINPERISYPDIDVDICMERRSEVIEYTVRKYGKNRVAQIITFGTMKAKMAIKDVGRVLSVPLAKVNALSKLVPEDPSMTLEKAYEIDPELRRLYETDDEVKQIIDIAKKLEGSVRNTGIHAAGLIIGAEPLMQHIPVCVSKESDMLVTQYSMKPVETVGMLKIDFLGLKTLTAIQKAVDAIELNSGKHLDWVNLDLEDQGTFALLNQGKTLGVFQLESGGMQDLAKQLHIDKFEEIIAVESLYRPGPMEMIPSFINRKHGRETIEIDHPLMREVLEETYGIMVYQEQVMQIASLLANYTLGEGDVLRRAMGKKDKEEMAKQREKFRKGALSQGVDEETSMRIFDKIEKFASYGFNKSHAAAYGYLTYVTAYLKAHYPKEWLAALMTSDREDLTKVAKIIREAQAMGIPILSPDVNESGIEFTASPSGIRFAMTAIKGVGEGVAQAILDERKKGGPFTSLYNFFKRVDAHKVGKKVVELLIEAGCFDFTGWSRQACIESVDSMHEAASRAQEESSKGILSLFGLVQDEHDAYFLQPPSIREKVPKYRILKRENELLGFYLTGHPLDEYRPHFSRLSCVPLLQVAEMAAEGYVRAAFAIESIQVKIASKTQRKFAVLTISEGMERFELLVWSDLYEEKQHLFQENLLAYAIIQADKQQGSLRLQCRWIDDLTKIDEEMIRRCDDAYDRCRMQAKIFEYRDKKNAVPKVEEAPGAKKLRVKLNVDEARHSHILELKSIFRSTSGKIPVDIEFFQKDVKLSALSIDAKWGVQFNRRLEEKLKTIPCVITYQWE